MLHPRLPNSSCFRSQSSTSRNISWLSRSYTHAVPIVPNFSDATLQGHTVSLFLRPLPGLPIGFRVSHSANVAEVEDQDGDTPPLLEPIFRSDLGASMADFQDAGLGGSEAAILALYAVTLGVAHQHAGFGSYVGLVAFR